MLQQNEQYLQNLPAEPFGAHMAKLRWKLSRKIGELTQRQFAARFGLTLGMVKDVERGRSRPLPALRVLVAAIELDPALIDRAVALARERQQAEELGIEPPFRA